MYKIIDLNFQKQSNLIASFLIKTSEGGIIIDPGPYSCFENLKNGIEANGLKLEDIKKVLLTHIHLDHAGGTWALAQKGAEIYVHPLGHPHLINPEKLIYSATKIYQDKMTELWSDIKSIPEIKVNILENEKVIEFIDVNKEKKKIIAYHTPGHANHHISYLIEDLFFAGDVLGMKIEDSPLFMPSPPPDIQLELWKKSILKIQKFSIKKILLTHFGEISECSNFIKKCLTYLADIEKWYSNQIQIEKDLNQIQGNYEDFISTLFSKKNCSAKLKSKISLVNPNFMSHQGLVRYFKKHKNILT